MVLVKNQKSAVRGCITEILIERTLTERFRGAASVRTRHEQFGITTWEPREVHTTPVGAPHGANTPRRQTSKASALEIVKEQAIQNDRHPRAIGRYCWPVPIVTRLRDWLRRSGSMDANELVLVEICRSRHEDERAGSRRSKIAEIESGNRGADEILLRRVHDGPSIASRDRLNGAANSPPSRKKTKCPESR